MRSVNIGRKRAAVVAAFGTIPGPQRKQNMESLAFSSAGQAHIPSMSESEHRVEFSFQPSKVLGT